MFQPLFPGESGVDQLVEIIKVSMIDLYFIHGTFMGPHLYGIDCLL